MSKNRLLYEDDVIKVVDKHTQEDGTLDDDISCILEEVKDVNDYKNNDSKIQYQPIISQIPKDSFITVPKVFIFDVGDLALDDSFKMQEILKKQIEDGCVVVSDGIKYIGAEIPFSVLSMKPKFHMNRKI